MRKVSEKICILVFIVILWATNSIATIVSTKKSNMDLSAVYCDTAAQYCLGIKSLSINLSDWSDDFASDNVVYARSRGSAKWQKIAILNPLLEGSMDGHIEIGNMKMHCNNYGVCLLASIVELKSGFWDVVTYITSDSGLHWNGPEYLNISETKVINIIDLSCNQSGYQCQILIQNDWFERTIIYKTDDFGKTWHIDILPKS